jgi:3-oxoacyl-[acyl-carrier protein] reductase
VGAFLECRSALVTGAARGIGYACAQLLAEHGAVVTMSDLDADALAASAARIGRDHHARCRAVAGDLTTPEMPQQVVDAAWDFGGLDIIVNAAGYNLNARIAQMDDETWSRMLEIHATVPFRILRAAAEYLKRAHDDDVSASREVFRKVVNVSSIAVMGSAFQSNYSAGKAALVGLTKSLAKEWAPMRINVNAVALGSIDTRLTQPRTAKNTANLGGAMVQLGTSPRAMEAVAGAIPFGRTGTPQEAAGGAFLLCTPWSDWITGQLLVVSGGQEYGMSA